MKKSASLLRPLLAVLLLCPAVALAHITADESVGGFAAGFTHPLFGLDHVVAMIAVGIWGAQLRAPAIWVLPVTFPLVMALGGVPGVAGVPLPGVEIGIAASAIVLGIMVALAARPPLWAAAVIVALFAVFHGYAHGAELPASASPVTFAAGFVVATGLLHLCGIALGLFQRWSLGERLMRAAGACIALVGAWFLQAALA